ncbi:MAG: M28 family peptidase [Elusimicrobia bacterium]|nr:M28 family peptidase [Elusimicrobiota bacterium]
MTSGIAEDRASIVERLKRDVETLSRDIGARDRGHRAGLERAADHVRRSLAASGGRIERQMFTVDDVAYENVLASFGPAEGDALVIGAHYDAVPGSPGADDNASGVAVLLEIARRLNALSLSRPVILAGYSLEESAFSTGDMGSIRHAQKLHSDRAGARLMISLEMLGFFTDRPASQGAPDPRVAARYPNAGNFLMIVGRPEDAEWTRLLEERLRQASTLPFFSINAPREVPGIDLSDHRNFWDAGFPAVMITDTAFYRNPHYHMPTDTADTLDYDRMSLAAAALAAVVNELGSVRD